MPTTDSKKSREFWRLWLPPITLMFALTLLLACTLYPLWRDDSLSRLQRAGAIRVGYAVEEPYAFVTGEGRVSGESPEIARYVIEQLAIPRIIWRQSTFDALLDELEAGRIDVIAAGMFITPQRQKRALFSLPTFHVRQGLLVLRGNPLGLTSMEQILESGAQIAILAGSVEEAALATFFESRDRLLRTPDALTGRRAVESGLAAGLVLSAPTVQWIALNAPGGRTEKATPFQHRPGENGWDGGFVFRLGEKALQQAWNQVLKDFIGSREHQQLVAPFGFGPEELPAIAWRRP